MNNKEEITEPDQQIIEVSPDTFGIESREGNTLRLTMTQGCGSACWADFKDSVVREGNTYNITTTARVTGEICTEQCVPYTREYEIELPEPGNYIFRYIISDSTAAILKFEWNEK